jgi:hypothetical protein
MNAPPSAAAFFYTLNFRTKPGDRIKHEQCTKLNKADPQTRLRLLLTHISQHTKAFCVVAASTHFFVAWLTLQCSTLSLPQSQHTRSQQSQRAAQPNASQATKNPTHRRKLNNIKWPYRFATHFFSYAYASMPTPRKKIL